MHAIHRTDLMQPFRALRSRVYQLTSCGDPQKIGRRAAADWLSILSSHAGGVGIPRWAVQEDRHATGELERLPAPLIGVLPDLPVARDGARPIRLHRFSESAGRRGGDWRTRSEDGMSRTTGSRRAADYVEDQRNNTPLTRITLRPHDPSTGEEVERRWSGGTNMSAANTSFR